MTITNYLYYGADRAKSRDELVIETGLSDRLVRKAIQHARDEGALILNTGEGYYMAAPQDVEAIEHQYKIDRARALSVLKRLKTMRRILKDAGRKV